MSLNIIKFFLDGKLYHNTFYMMVLLHLMIKLPHKKYENNYLKI